MAVMKTLAIAMEDAVLDNPNRPEIEEARRQAWHDGIAGIYNPEQYKGYCQIAYRDGRQHFEETCAEEGITL